MEFDGLVKRIGELKKLIGGSMPAIRNEVDFIIRSHVDSVPRIERALDTLLGYVPLGYGKKEFERLNRYYSGISRENSRQYAVFLREALER